ncbi:MAG: DUF58 domain-containing protein [Verrucomicrobiota bacterium]
MSRPENNASSTPSPTAPLAALRRLEWRVRHAVENVLGGEYRSAFRGRGMEFDQVVRYEFGDDVRDIDWNVTARLGEPYRKKFVEEREVTVLIVFEDTPSLQFGSGDVTKREALLELAGFLMLLGAINRDRVGFVHVLPDGKHTLRPPMRGRGAIHHAAANLFTLPAPAIDAPVAERPLLPWQLILRAAPRHSIVVWLGDFAPRTPPEGWPLLQERFQTLGFRVEDPWERDFPDGRLISAYDPLAGRLVTLENTPATRTAHGQWRKQREQSWTRLFPDQRARLTVGTDQNRLDALVRFFRERMGAR